MNAPQRDAQAVSSRIQTWFSARSPWQRRAIAVIAGAAATLGHAPFQFAPIFIAAIVVLVWLLDVSATQPKRLWSGFATGWFFALGHMTTGLYWVSSAFNVESDVWGPLWGIPATLALAGGMALFWGLGATTAMVLWTRDARRLAAFALCVFASEWLRGHVFGGFPWLLPGYVWTPGEPVSQFASIASIYGLSLLTLLIAAAPAAIADGQARPGLRFGPLIGAALVVGMLWGWGAQRIAGAPIGQPGAQPVVRVADSGLSQAEKWRYRPDQEWRVLGRYLEASGPPTDDARASILVWPEGAIPTLNFFVLDNPQYMAALGRGLGDRAVIMGLARCEPRPKCDAYMHGEGHVDQLRLYNSAAVIDGVSGVPRLSQTYDKHRLVPFGEFIPLWSLVSHLNIAPLQRIGAGFTPGPPSTRLVVPDGPPAVVLICYEAIFPGAIPRGDERPGWIVSITNDAWFGEGTGPYQHYEMARYRSIEEGLPMARAASGGISAIVDSFGREIHATQRRGGYAEAQLPPALSGTILSRWGSLGLVLLLVFTAILRFFPARSPG